MTFYILQIITLLGGLSLFLFGMDIMGSSLERLAGGKLQTILAKMSSNVPRGFLLGMAVTAVIQSSSATTVMVVGFVNSGIMTLNQAVGVIMGSNVGTTVTAWILSLSGLEGDSFVTQMLNPNAWSPILGFIGVAICLISFFITLIVSASFNQDNFVRLIVFVCSNILGWLLYLSFQTVIFDSYEIWKLKSSKKKASAGIIWAQEEQLQDANEPAAPTPMPTNREATPDIKPVEIAIAPELHEKNRASYEDRQKQEEAERIRMVMEYIHFVMPRIADKETVNHICAEVNKWMCLHSYKPKPITGRLTREITNIPLRHFVWNISERFMYKKYYNGDNRANFIKTLFPREFADTDIATIKNFKVDPSKTLIPIDEPENGSLDFHYPEDYARKVNS